MFCATLAGALNNKNNNNDDNNNNNKYVVIVRLTKIDKETKRKNVKNDRENKRVIMNRNKTKLAANTENDKVTRLHHSIHHPKGVIKERGGVRAL